MFYELKIKNKKFKIAKLLHCDSVIVKPCVGEGYLLGEGSSFLYQCKMAYSHNPLGLKVQLKSQYKKITTIVCIEENIKYNIMPQNNIHMCPLKQIVWDKTRKNCWKSMDESHIAFTVSPKACSTL